MMTKGFKVVEDIDENNINKYWLEIVSIDGKPWTDTIMKGFSSVPTDLISDTSNMYYNNSVDQKYIDIVFNMVDTIISGGRDTIKEYMITSDPSYKEIEAVVVIKTPKNAYIAMSVNKNYNEEIEEDFFNFVYDENLEAIKVNN